MLSSEMVKAGRALAKWSQSDLSEISDVSLASIKRIEGKAGTDGASLRTIDKIRKAFETVDIVFQFHNDKIIIEQKLSN